MQNSGKRWFIAVMATLVHLCLGTVYAWSFFQKTVSETFGWSNSETAWAFSLAIFMLGVTASWGGQNLQKFVEKISVNRSFSLCFWLYYFLFRFAKRKFVVVVFRLRNCGRNWFRFGLCNASCYGF